MKAIGNVINNFRDENELPQAQKEMELAHCPPQLHSTGMIKGHFKVNTDIMPGFLENSRYVTQMLHIRL